jgi:hypothetical protein
LADAFSVAEGAERQDLDDSLTLLLLQPIAPRLDLDQRQDDVAVALAGPAHGPQMVEDSRLDVDEELPAASLYRPQGRVPGGR